jgi:predicted transcriptional regulator
MAKEIKTKKITIEAKGGTFSSIFQRMKISKKDSDIAALRQLFSNEKARLLHVIKTKQPSSIYELAKLVGRDFKAVRHDIKLLEEFGFVELISSRKNGKDRLKPVVDADQIVITVDIK